MIDILFFSISLRGGRLLLLLFFFFCPLLLVAAAEAAAAAAVPPAVALAGMCASISRHSWILELLTKAGIFETRDRNKAESIF